MPTAILNVPKMSAYKIMNFLEFKLEAKNRLETYQESDFFVQRAREISGAIR